jgi:hypothetical protein
MSLEIYAVDAKVDPIAGLERYIGIRSIDSISSVDTLNMPVKRELTQGRLSRRGGESEVSEFGPSRRFNWMAAPARTE